MITVQGKSILVVGISVRTTNENGQAKQDIGGLWGQFIEEGVRAKIPNVVDESIYAVYTEYEGDHSKPYTAILGYRVDSLNEIPDGMVGHEIEPGDFEKFTAKGNLKGDAVIGMWNQIWNANLDRAYTSDFEVYGEKAANPSNGEADIFIALN